MSDRSTAGASVGVQGARPLVPGGRWVRGSRGTYAPEIGAYGGEDAEFWDLDWDGYYEWWQPGEYDYGVYPGEGWDCDDGDEEVYPGNGC